MKGNYAMAVVKKKKDANHLRAARRASDFSQAELARRSGLHPTTVCLIENGRLVAYPSQIEKLLAALDAAGLQAQRIRAQIGERP